MANRENYQRRMEKELEHLADAGERPALLLHACCAPCSSAVLERLAGHFALTILYYNPNIDPPAEYRRREDELERFVREAGWAQKGITVVELPYRPEEFDAAARGLEGEPERVKEKPVSRMFSPLARFAVVSAVRRNTPLSA